jgi:hypothetical protein
MASSTTEQTLRESLASKLSAVEIQANTGEVFRQSVVNTLERRLYFTFRRLRFMAVLLVSMIMVLLVVLLNLMFSRSGVRYIIND